MRHKTAIILSVCFTVGISLFLLAGIQASEDQSPATETVGNATQVEKTDRPEQAASSAVTDSTRQATATRVVTPTATPIPTETSTPTSTLTPTPMMTPTVTCTPTFTFTPTPTFTFTPTPLRVTYFLDRLIDLDRLAVREDPAVRTGQFSSYDRKSKYDAEKDQYVEWDANADHGHYLRVDPKTGEAVMAEIEGPGCIWRIWSANPKGRIRFYLDGAETPTYEFDFNDLFDRDKSPFPSPLVWQRRVDLGGDNPASNCYMPIPFAESIKITMDKAHDQYYHIGYSVFPKDRRIQSFSLDLTPHEKAKLEEVCNKLKQCGTDPQPVEGLQEISKEITLVPGTEEVLADLKGPGTIRRFFAKVHSDERYARRKILLRIYWDGEKEPSVEAPLGDFFGDAWDEAEYNSLPMGITDDMNYCFWRMPFAQSAKVVVVNEGQRSARLKYRIGFTTAPIPPNALYFHAGWRRDAESRDFDYAVLECTGTGRFVGAVLFPDNIVGGWWGEGDEKIYVDGEKFPSTFGTGSEDYFGDAWGYRHFANPYHGCPTQADYKDTRRQSAYRWHISDNIPFTRSFRITIENYSALRKNPPKNDYSSMAYWYQAPGGSDFFGSVPVEDRIPQGPFYPGAVEAEESLAETSAPENVAVISDDFLENEASKHRCVKISGRPGTRVAFEIPVSETGKYVLDSILLDTDEGAGAVPYSEGRPVGEWVTLRAGKNRIELMLTGGDPGRRYSVVVDCFTVRPFLNYVRKWYVVGPFDNENDTAFDRACGPEREDFDLDRKFEGLDGLTGWTEIQAPKSGIVDLKEIYDEDRAVAYASSVVFSPSDRRATVFVGSNDAVKVWINGKLVHRNPKNRPLKPDEDRFEVSLDRGWNTILVKVTQIGSKWGFTFRIHDPQNELIFRSRIPQAARQAKVPAPIEGLKNLVGTVGNLVKRVLCCCPQPCSR